MKITQVADQLAVSDADRIDAPAYGVDRPAGAGSVVAPAALSDRRRTPRTYTIFRLIRVETSDNVGLGRCRNISDGGMKFDSTMPLDVAQPLRITFSPALKLAARVMWRKGHECGIQFDQPIDSAGTIARAAEEVRLLGAWGLRLQAQLPARLWVDGRTEDTVVTDLAPRSVRLSHPTRFAPGLHVRLLLNCGKERDGIVRWSRDDVAVILLMEPFSIDELGSMREL